MRPFLSKVSRDLGMQHSLHTKSIVFNSPIQVEAKAALFATNSVILQVLKYVQFEKDVDIDSINALDHNFGWDSRPIICDILALHIILTKPPFIFFPSPSMD